MQIWSLLQNNVEHYICKSQQLRYHNVAIAGCVHHRSVKSICWKVSVSEIFGSMFSLSRPKCRDLQSNAPYSVRIGENTEQQNSVIWTFILSEDWNLILFRLFFPNPLCFSVELNWLTPSYLVKSVLIKLQNYLHYTKPEATSIVLLWKKKQFKNFGKLLTGYFLFLWSACCYLGFLETAVVF